jgi:hypothetical protein
VDEVDVSLLKGRNARDIPEVVFENVPSFLQAA